MTISASTDRPPFNVSRSVNLNMFLIFATLAAAVVAMAVQLLFDYGTRQAISNPIIGASGWLAKLRFFSDLSWLLIVVMLIGLSGSAYTLIKLFVYRLSNARQTTISTVRVQMPSISLLIASFIVGILSLLSLLQLIPSFIDLFKDFDIRLPGLTIFYLSFINFITNPVNDNAVFVTLALFAVLFLVKEFLLKDKVTTYLINAFVALFILVWFVFLHIAALLPFTAILKRIMELS
ncbi:MAG: hypothetical protein ACYC6A_14950 [Armatimonadota bacterium]